MVNPDYSVDCDLKQTNIGTVTYLMPDYFQDGDSVDIPLTFSTNPGEYAYLDPSYTFINFIAVSPARNQWTWMSGSNSIKQFGVYGVKGTPSISNIPGARTSGVSWTDQSGNLWLFGGVSYPVSGDRGDTNDLWKYNLSTNEWTWVSGTNDILQPGIYGTKGQASISNIPGARDSGVSWTDSSGNFWLFGGNGYINGGNGMLNDLWEYSPSTNEWTWVSGANTVGQSGIYGIKGIPSSSNMPGARSNSISWTDNSGNFWLFGGNGYSANGTRGSLNDLWKYDLNTHMWTWVSGESTVKQSGAYGVKGSPSLSNVPGAREGSISWTDNSGNLWLFGGDGYATSVNSSILNDLWKYNPSTNEWTWMSGANTSGNHVGEYGTKGEASSSNTPGSRYYSISWTDNSGNLWLFGGWGYTPNSGGFGGLLNDLWKYNPSTNEWTWVSGANTYGQYGVYGTQGQTSVSNMPGSRYFSMGWVDIAGNLWLFGGNGYASGSADWLNDLWKYNF